MKRCSYDDELILMGMLLFLMLIVGVILYWRG